MPGSDVLNPQSFEEAAETLNSPKYELEPSCWSAMQKTLFGLAHEQTGRRRVAMLFCSQIVGDLVYLLDKEPPLTPTHLQAIRKFRDLLVRGVSAILKKDIQSEQEYDYLFEAFSSLALLKRTIWEV